MQTRHRVLISLGLAAVFSVLPHARAVTTTRAKLSSSALSTVLPAPPCIAPILAQVSASAPTPLKFTHLPNEGDIQLGELANSCWVSSDEMILFNGHQLIKFNTATGEEIPIAGTQDANSGKHWASIISLSPDGRWLVWAGGVDGHSTWDAVSVDGTEHRQWPRAESISTPAIAWMQDNVHWVELSVPETKNSGIGWQPHPDNMRARVFSIDMPGFLDFPLQLETPNPNFQLESNVCHYGCEFLFTADGHAWLTCGFAVSGYDNPSISYTSYELLPNETVWKLHKTVVAPEADQEHWMFDDPTRSPDGNWITWRNYSAEPGCKMNSDWRLMLSRNDGSDMKTLYQSNSRSGGSVEWSPDSRQIALATGGLEGICTMKLDQVIANVCTKLNSPQHQIASVLRKGPFPISHRIFKPLDNSRVAAQH